MGVEFAGVEGFGEVVVEAVGIGLVGAGEGVGDDDTGLGIDGPVDEEAEAEIAELFEASGLVEGTGGRAGWAEARLVRRPIPMISRVSMLFKVTGGSLSGAARGA